MSARDTLKRRIGRHRVLPIGLGAMPLSQTTDAADRDAGIALIHRALDAGIRLIDTARIYAPAWHLMGHNEALVAEAVRSWQGAGTDDDPILIATKGGISRTENAVLREADYAALRRDCEASLTHLGTDRIDIYYLHRHAPTPSWAEQVEALARLKQDGLVQEIALSNASPAQLETALSIVGGASDGGIVAVQNEFSPRFRADAEVIALCGEHGIAFVPWSPFGGSDQAADVGSRYAAFAEVARRLQCSVHQVVLAWLLARADNIIPIPGCSRRATLDDCLAALDITLTAADLTALDATDPEGSSRFPDDVPAPPLTRDPA